MKTLRTHLKGISIGLASVMLMASSSQALDSGKVYDTEELSIADMYFNEECSSYKYITIYNSKDGLVYDGMVRDAENITDKELNELLSKSDFLMSNQITDYYIITD